MDLFAFDDLYVRRLKEHDRVTEDHFSEYFSRLLYAKLCRRVPEQDIEDIIQDVLARALARLDDLREGCKLGAFVLGICNNVLHEYFRPDRRTEPLDETHKEIPARNDIEAEFLNEETAECVREVLNGMRNRRDKDILRAIFLEEGDRDEVCRRFDVDDKYLRVLLHRAKKKFKAAYRPKCKR